MEKRSRTKIVAITASLALAAALGAAVSARSSQAGDDDDQDARGARYDNRSIKGSWGFNGSFGVYLPPGTTQQIPSVGMGRIYFDGNGGCKLTTIATVGDRLFRSEASSCKYQVGPDGIGTSEAVLPGAPVNDPVPISFVIVDQGRELRGINNRFVVGSLTFRRQ